MNEKLTLYEYQLEVQNSNHAVTIVSAPTGAGKTLASLLKALKQFEENESSGAIFTYPTNELVNDQALSIKALLMQLGYDARILNLELIEKDDDKEPNNSSFINIAIITGDQLEEDLKRYSSFRTKGDLIRNYFKAYRGFKIILTNPDFFDVLFKGLYRHSRMILPVIPDFGLIVYDEFHLYSGISLTKIFFHITVLINTFKQFIISTATPIQIEDIFQKILTYNRKHTYYSKFITEEIKIIQPRTTPERKTENDHYIQYPIEINFIPIHNEKVFYSEKDIEKFTQQIQEHFICFNNQNVAKDNGLIPIVGISNSQIFCENLYLHLLKKMDKEKIFIKRIHGLIPKSERKMGENPDILLGTAVIEVGIDFNTPHLIFEAHDGASFLQRLGRCARKQPAQVTAFIPKYIFNRLSLKLKENYDLIQSSYLITGSEQISKNIFFQIIDEIFPSLSPHLNFLMSFQALQLWISFFISFYQGYDVTNPEDIYRPCERPRWWNKEIEVFKILKTLLMKSQNSQKNLNNSDFQLIFPPFWKEEIMRKIKNHHYTPDSIIWSLFRSNLRGVGTSIPAYWKNFNSFSFISFNEFPRLIISNVISVSNFITQFCYVKIPKRIRYHFTQQIIIIDGFKSDFQGPSHLKVIIGKDLYNSNKPLKQGSLTSKFPSCYIEFVIEDENLRMLLLTLLEGEILFVMKEDHLEDWRLSNFLYYRNKERYLVIYGPDALLGNYLLEKKHNENE